MTTLLAMILSFARAETPSGVPRTWTKPMVCEQLLMKGLDARRPLEEIYAKAKAQERTIELVAKHRIDGPDQAYFLGIAKSASAALGKHHRQFLKEPDLRKMDIPHHMAILRAIAAFDFKRPRWSMFQIDEAIKLRHSSEEYENCKE